MSFDIFYMPCRFGDNRVATKDPVTGETKSFLPNEPLTADELKAVQELLECHHLHDQGFYVVEFDDGGMAQVFDKKDLADGFMVALRGMTPDLLQFLFALLKAGNWVMIPAMEDTAAITTSTECLKGIPAGFPRIVVCNSAEDLGGLLTSGVRGWQKYRDQVCGSED
jgi:hypothetical protein